MSTTTPTPVPVHLVGADVQLAAKTAAAPQLRAVYHTVILTADEGAQHVLPASNDRVAAWIQAIDDDIVINGKLAEAANGRGAVVPKANTAPYPVTDSGPVYAGVITALTGTNTARVAVSAVYRKDASCSCR